MPLASWLRALFPKRPSPDPAPATAKAPVSREDKIQIAAILPTNESAKTEHKPELFDNGVRMHIAAHDPEFPAKREAAVESILSAIDKVAQAHGFTKKAMSWAKSGTLGTISIHLQRSLYGFDCHINLGFQPLAGECLGPWAMDDFVQLDRFFPPVALADRSEGALTYLDVHEDEGCLAQTMDVLDGRALPWLEAQLNDPEAHSLPFLPSLVPLAKAPTTSAILIRDEPEA